MKRRFTVFDPLSDFYRKQTKPIAGDICEFSDQIRRWYTDKIRKLNKDGYRENIKADVTGGDHDKIVIDHKNKEWCWWENGFTPFCSSRQLPTNHTLTYWSNHRR